MRKRLRATIQTIAKGCKRFFGLFTPPTLAVFGGAALTAWGLWMVNPALSAIVTGAVLTGFGLWLAGMSLPERPRGRK